MVFVLLVVLVTLPASFAGYWLWLAASRPRGSATPVWWLVVPPVIVLTAMAVLTWLEPGLTARRRGLRPVAPGGPAPERFGQLAARAGIRRVPTMLDNPASRSETTAQALGRPGSYAVVVPGRLQGKVRYSPLEFDVTVGHELAHVRAGDVAMYHFARNSWLAAAAVLAVPVVVHLVRPGSDFSLLTGEVWRAVPLVLAVVAGRAYLMRIREHYADVRATPTAEEGDAFADYLERLPPRGPAGPALRRLWALHPTRARRVAVLRDPSLLERPSPLIMLLAGFATGSTVAPAWFMLSAPGGNPLSAEYLAQAVGFGLMAAVLGCELARGGFGRTGTGLFGVLTALVAGLAVGTLCGIGVPPDIAVGNVAGTITVGLVAAGTLLAVTAPPRPEGQRR